MLQSAIKIIFYILYILITCLLKSVLTFKLLHLKKIIFFIRLSFHKTVTWLQFCFVEFYCILFRFVLWHFILMATFCWISWFFAAICGVLFFNDVLFYGILWHFVTFFLFSFFCILWHFVPFCFMVFCAVLWRLVLWCFDLL